MIKSETVEMNIDSSQQQQHHNGGTNNSNLSTSLHNLSKQGLMAADSNNNIENSLNNKSYLQNGENAHHMGTDPNNNPLIMMTSNSSGGDTNASRDSLLYDDQQQNGTSHHHQIKQEDSDQEGNSLMSNDYCNSKTNLIVNYLPQNMTQDEIKELFASIGQVESCKLIKDKLTGQSLGYAFVNYTIQEDADKAIYSLNGMRLQNKTIKVSLARPSSESIKGANLYICGLPKNFTQVELEKMFNEFGTIISSKILTDSKTGESKGVGFVRFDKRMEAESAIEKLNGKMYENIPEPLVVKFANSPTSVKAVMGMPLAPFIPTCRGFYQPYRTTSTSSYRYSPMNVPAPPPQIAPQTASGGPAAALAAAAAYCTTAPQVDPTTTLLHPHHQVAALNGLAASLPATPGLTTSSTAPTLTTLAAAAPILTTANSTTNAQQAPGTTSVTTPTGAATHLLQSPPPTSLSSHSLSSINYAGWCIFVYNLGPESDESLLWQLFGPFGAVQSVKVIRDLQTHKCKGFGFVTMSNYDEACTAINCLNGLNLQNRILQVSFKTNSKHMF